MFSALPPTTDIGRPRRHDRKVPQAEARVCRSTLPSDPKRGGRSGLMLGTFGLGFRFFAMTKSRGLWSGVRTDQPEKGSIMSRRTLISLAASVIVGIACLATISTDAFAYRRGVGVGRAGVHHGGVYRGGVYRGAAVRRGVAVGVGAAAVGAAARRCGYYPYPPCY